MLKVENIEKKFGGLIALSDLNFELAKGQVLGLIGPNGAGKTTALNLLSGIFSPSQGRLSFNGADMTRLSTEKRARLGLGRTFQNIRLFDELSVLENVKTGAHANHGKGIFKSVLNIAGNSQAERRITEIAENALEMVDLADKAHLRANQLSYGDQRRVEIARALACEPLLLMLDEPAAGMNDIETAALADLILSLNQEFGLTIALIEHHIPMVKRVCGQLLVLNRGVTVTSGKTDAVLADERVIEVYFGKRKNHE